ncbi:MAG: IMP dehydrogenase [Methanosarcinales archaeon Met12]|nr:MAG: IMP dehydrogenase [Methanosarcinales archaeon Met12]
MFVDKLNVPSGITFDDVLLLPCKSNVEPDQVDVTSRMSKNVSLNIPIVSAAMDTVTEADMAIAMAHEGGIGVIHRNMSRERQVNEIREVKRADELLVRDVVTIAPNTSVQAVWHLMTKEKVSGIPVVGISKRLPTPSKSSDLVGVEVPLPKELSDGKLIGIVSRRDIRPIVESNPTKKVEKVMTKDLITGHEGIPLDDALERMYEHKIERLPIVDKKGNLKGMISMQDILHRHQHPRAIRDEEGRLMVAAAVGPFDVERAVALDAAGADVLVVDCAHAHNMNVVNSAKVIKKKVGADVVVGNIATAEAAEELVGFVDGIKVGVGPGSICTTRIVTGVGVPQLTAIASVVDVARKHKVPVIADGGMKYSGDIAKAIAVGANSVMVGNLIAGTDEAPGRTMTIKGRRYKQYRGMGSLGAMSGGESSDRYFQEKRGGLGSTKFVPEGVEGAIPYSGTVKDVTHQLVGGLKSAMGYIGAQNIGEMHKKARFIKITPSGYKEGHPHDVLITDEAPNYPIDE